MATTECTTMAAGAAAESENNSTSPAERRTTVRSRTPYVEYRLENRNRRDPPPMPLLQLSGRWLERAGFSIDQKVRVAVSQGRLILEAVQEICDPRSRTHGEPPRIAERGKQHHLSSWQTNPNKLEHPKRAKSHHPKPL